MILARRNEDRQPATIPFPKPPQAKVNFQFSMIPDSIMRDTELYPGAKILFGVILSSCRRGRCFMGNPELARSSGLSVKQVRRLLQDLEFYKLIIRDLNGKRREEIRVNFTCPKLGQAHAPSCPQEMPQVVQMDAPSWGTDLENDGEKRSESDFSLPPEEEEFNPGMRRFFSQFIPTSEGGPL